MIWTTVRVRPGAHRDAALAAMFAGGAGGVQEDGESLVTHIDESLDLQEFAAAIRRSAPDAVVETAS